MHKETKKERFERVATARTEKAIDMLRLLGNCSAKNNYSFEENQVISLLHQIQSEVDNVYSKFHLHKQNTEKSGLQPVLEQKFTWIQGFERNVLRFPDRDALFFPKTGEHWTYRELDIEANRLANALKEAKIGFEDVVMLQLMNCPVFVFAYIATQKLGAVSCPVSFRLSPGESAAILEDSCPKALIVDSMIQQDTKTALRLSAHQPDTVIVSDLQHQQNAIDGFIPYEHFVAGSPSCQPEIPLYLDMYTETTRLYTPGTTGRQKGVPIRSINEIMSAHDVIFNFPLTFADKTMNTTPWFHRGGLHSGGPCPTLYVGGTVVILEKFEPELVLQYVEQFELTFLIGVPAVLERLADTQQQQGRNLSSLKGIITMGSALDRAACIRYQKQLTPRIFNGYGTTETFWNTFLRPEDLPEMAGSAGRACTDDQVLLVEAVEDGRAEPTQLVPHDNQTVGEIIVRAPGKSPCCYHNNPAETAAKYYKGFLYTGDLGTWDAQGFFTIVGRKDDMIISAGENIYPTQVEEILLTHPAVKDCIVTSVPDRARGEVVTAYIVRKSAKITAEDMDLYCKKSPMIANFKRPRYYRFVQEIPRNASGKKLHYKAKKMAKDDLKNGLLYQV